MLAQAEIRRVGRQIPKTQFDELCRQKKIENPQRESFGDGYGDPYNPTRLIFGYFKGQLVWIESNAA